MDICLSYNVHLNFFVDIHPNVSRVKAVANPATVANPILLLPCSNASGNIDQ